MESILRMLNRFTGGNDGEVSASADKQKNLLVAQGNPPYMELRRRGDGWTVQTATLLAPLVAIPTTVAALELYNNGNRALVVSDLFASHILATAAVQTHAIYAMVSTQKSSPTLTALKIHSLSGKPLITSTVKGELVTGVGTTVIDNGWRPWGTLQNFNLAAATPGESWSVPVDGKLVLPPGASLCLHIVGALATASSFQVGCDFDWVKADLEA
jgi:hypothetical protein